MILGEHQAVVVPGPVAVWLDAQIGTRRAGVRDLDPRLYRVLLELHEVALATRVRRGRPTQATAPTQQRQEWISTGTAATRLGIGTEAIRAAIRRKRLPARLVAGRYEIHHDDIEAYRSRRCA